MEYEKIGFKKFIGLAFKSNLFENTPAGDFINDANFDKKFEDFKTLKALEEYLGGLIGVCPEARIEAKRVFKMWEQTHGSIEHG